MHHPLSRHLIQEINCGSAEMSAEQHRQWSYRPVLKQAIGPLMIKPNRVLQQSQWKEGSEGAVKRNP